MFGISSARAEAPFIPSDVDLSILEKEKLLIIRNARNFTGDQLQPYD